MSFNSHGGILFAIFVLVLYNFIKGHKFQNLFLLVASFYFYATSSPIFTSLLLATIYIGYSSGILIEAQKREGKPSHIHMTLAITALLLMLGIFKYYGFFVDSFAATLHQFGLNPTISTLKIVLPVGISFYVFQTIGYVIDVNRGNVAAEENLVDFALFVSFFPQLVAGPIERSRNLLKQVKMNRPAVQRSDVVYGVFLIVQGYVKKVVIADNLAPYVNALFKHDNLSAPMIWVGLLFFAIQIYGDFSGYTDIARGYSRLLGFRILINFNRPYIARSPADFWRRWHISLSSWFTEYVYFSLGGNRSKTLARRDANVMATMTLSGLWHGASANFIVWGAYHGFLILTGRLFAFFIPETVRKTKIAVAISIVFTFFLMLYGWMYFRITNFQQIMTFNHALLTQWDGWAPALAFLANGLIFLLFWIIIDILEVYWLDIHAHEVKRYRGIWIYIGLMLFVVLTLHAVDPSTFIYFRF